MEQLCIFEKHKKKQVTRWNLYIDGAARNNPGPAGAGIVILKDDKIIRKEGYYLGLKTNNQAEYLALLLGIFIIKQLMHPEDQLVIITDSELMVRQLQGIYAVKNPELKKLFTLAKQLLVGISCQVQHVLRTENKQADRMANIGIKTKNAVPESFLQLIAEHSISW